jgi:hypothetical protein
LRERLKQVKTLKNLSLFSLGLPYKDNFCFGVESERLIRREREVQYPNEGVPYSNPPH